MEFALLILKKYWPYIALALVVMGFLSYLKVVKLERDHYEKKAITVQATLDKIVVDNKIKQGALEQAAKEQTAKFAAEYETEQKAMQMFYIERNKYYAQMLQANKQVRDLRLSLDTVRLFNATKSNDVAKPQDSTAANSGHAGEATAASEVTGEQLFNAIKTNDENHLACIKVVEKWQNFWLGYTEDVKRAETR